MHNQGIGDSSQGFANAILFVIFTKNIRESFVRCLCCGKTFRNDDLDSLEGEGQIQANKSNQSSHLSQLSGSGSRRGSPEPVTADNNFEGGGKERAPLVFTSLGSNVKTPQTHRYGSVS